MLYYQKLDVSQIAIQFVAAAEGVSKQLPKGYSALPISCGVPRGPFLSISLKE